MKQESITRKCIVSGNILLKDDLLRFVAGPDNLVIPDFKKRLPGKGVYVSNSRQMLQKAIEKNLFAKALKIKVKPIDNLSKMVEDLLRKSALDAVSLARKAGCFVSGMDKVCEVLKKNKVAFLLEAMDAGADGTEKIMRLAGDLKIFRLFTTEELDKALDKINTVHAALIKSEMAEIVKLKFEKMSDFLNS